MPHESAEAHIKGAALFIDDLPEPEGLVHLALGSSSMAHAHIRAMNLDDVRAAPGVIGVFTATDLIGANDVSVYAGDEPLFADGLVTHAGQSLFAVAARTAREARYAATLAKIDYAPLENILTLRQALQCDSHIEPTQKIVRGDAAAAMKAAGNRLKGQIEIGGQEHFYLEGQIAVAIPGEAGSMLVYSSTQNPSQIQSVVARILDRHCADITVETRRIGGGFGGKETQPALFAAAAALVAALMGRPTKLRIDRETDMVMTGKRHDFLADYQVGYSADGKISGLRITLSSRCGDAVDLSASINDRAMLHIDNCYQLNDIEIISHRLKTNTVSNTAFRGFGAPQSVMAIERILDHIACNLNVDPLDVRKVNLYQSNIGVTPYDMPVGNFAAGKIIDELEDMANYRSRRLIIEEFNSNSTRIKRGIALTPVKFGISFTKTSLNQGGALLQVYADGSVLLNHGGIEMGQGLLTKVNQIVSQVLGLEPSEIRACATRTDKVPNTSATAASASTDINGMAAYKAACEIRDRLTDVFASTFEVSPEIISFRDGHIIADELKIPFSECCHMAYDQRVSLSSNGFYKTPEIYYDRDQHSGCPFYYFACGAAISEVAIDKYTGEYRVLRVDILHDVGHSINPSIDIGQIEGGFIQGLGWLTTEEIVFDVDGQLTTRTPSTYKIPTCASRPAIFNTSLYSSSRQDSPAIFHSKAVGEPPFLLSISVFSALNAALAHAERDSGLFFDAPGTPERVLIAAQRSADKHE